MELTSSIENDIQSFNNTHFQPFLQSQQVLLHNVDAQLSDQVASFTNDYSSLLAERSRFSHIAAEQQQEAEEETAKINDINKQIKQMEIHANMLPTQIEVLKSNERILTTKNVTLKNEVDTLTTMKLREIDAVTRGVTLFQNTLGVNFSVDAGKLKIAFIYIDKQDMNKEFACWIFVDENKQYQVDRCEPSLSSIDQLLTQLNTSNHFATFIQQLRQQFVNLARQ